ncbi:MAG: hypothetical protein DCC68_22210 [Planctomycetota bacterium]|nr:MAG: hypothetical protein DCC68_22210 [Planctomycetota bacterium]
MTGFSGAAITVNEMTNVSGFEVLRSKIYGNGGDGIRGLDDGAYRIEENEIYANGGDGIDLSEAGSGSVSGLIAGNYIGTNASGTGSGNGSHGIRLGRNSEGVVARNNRIWNNSGDGVRLTQDALKKNRITTDSTQPYYQAGLNAFRNNAGEPSNQPRP